MGRLDNKIAIITGGASGIGEKMVDFFSQEGAIVIAAVGSTSEESLWKN